MSDKFSYIPAPSYDDKKKLVKLGVKFGENDGFNGYDGFVLVKIPGTWNIQPEIRTKAVEGSQAPSTVGANLYICQGRIIFEVTYFTVDIEEKDQHRFGPYRNKHFTGTFSMMA